LMASFFEEGDDTRIKFRQENPKRPGSVAYELYAAYKDAVTVGEAREKGCRSIDFSNDFAKGYLTILKKTRRLAFADAEHVTPKKKRPRTDEAQEPLQLSGKKPEAPATKRKQASAASATIAAVEGDLVAQVAEMQAHLALARPSAAAASRKVYATCQHFLHFLIFAGVLGTVGEDGVLGTVGEDKDLAAAAVAAGLGTFVCSATEDVVIAALLLLVAPPPLVPDDLLRAAVAEAFDVVVDADLSGEALARKALEGRSRKACDPEAPPLLIVDVAAVVLSAAGREAGQVSRVVQEQLASLLASTQAGMEAFFLVMALKGRLTPCRVATRQAVARAAGKTI